MTVIRVYIYIYGWKILIAVTLCSLDQLYIQMTNPPIGQNLFNTFLFPIGTFIFLNQKRKKKYFFPMKNKH